MERFGVLAGVDLGIGSVEFGWQCRNALRCAVELAFIFKRRHDARIIYIVYT